MERKAYIELCQRASFKMFYAKAWWRAKWNPDELVYWEKKPFVPMDYRFGFIKGNAQHLAIIHDLEAVQMVMERWEAMKDGSCD